MSEGKRQQDRTEIFMIAEYRPYRSRQSYAIGITTDISDDGFCFEAQGGDLKVGDALEFLLKDPNGEIELSASGSVIWKRDSWYKCVIGVEFLDMDEDGRRKLLETVTAFKQQSDTPLHQIREPENTRGKEIKEKPYEIPVPEPRLTPDNKAVKMVQSDDTVPRSPVETNSSPVHHESDASMESDRVQEIRLSSSPAWLRRRRKKPLHSPLIALVLMLGSIALTVAVKHYSIFPEIFTSSSSDESPAEQVPLVLQPGQLSVPPVDQPVVTDQGKENGPEAGLSSEETIPGNPAIPMPETNLEKASGPASSSEQRRKEIIISRPPVKYKKTAKNDNKELPSLVSRSIPAETESQKKQKAVEQQDEIKTLPEVIIKEKDRAQGDSLPNVQERSQDTTNRHEAIKDHVQEDAKTEIIVESSASPDSLQKEQIRSSQNFPIALIVRDRKTVETNTSPSSSEGTTSHSPEEKHTDIALVIPKLQDKKIAERDKSDSKWTAVGKTHEGAEVFVDPRSIVWPARNTLRVRTRVLNDNQEFVDLLEIDCLRNLAHVPEGHISANRLLFTYAIGWKDISPESMPEIVSNATCPIDRQ